MIYDGFDFSDYFVVQSIDRSVVANIATSASDISDRAGSLFRKSQRGSKKIGVSVYLRPQNSIDEITNLLTYHLVKDRPKRLELPDKAGLYEMAILDGDTNIKRLFWGMKATFTFLNPEGVFFAMEETTGTTNNGNMEAPFIFTGKTSKKGKATISNGVDVIEIDTSGLRVGTKIEIDTEFETVLINGLHDMGLVSLRSLFFWLGVGENNITISGLEGVITHRARYL